MDRLEIEDSADQPEIECTNCGWQGWVGELLCRPHDFNKPVGELRFNVCPECGKIDCFEDFEFEG